MQDDATRLIDSESTRNFEINNGGSEGKEQNPTTGVIETPVANKRENKAEGNNNGLKMAGAGAGGFVAGAAVTAGASALAHDKDETPNTEDLLAEDEDNKDAQEAANLGGGIAQNEGAAAHPAPEQEVRVEHVHIVEHHVVDDTQSHAHAQQAHMAEATHSEPLPQSQADTLAVEPVDNDVRVLEVGIVEDGNGHAMGAALLEAGGDQALMLDVDLDGSIDVLVHDDNFNGQIEANEIHDVSDADISLADLMQAQDAQQGGMYYADTDITDYSGDMDGLSEV